MNRILEGIRVTAEIDGEHAIACSRSAIVATGFEKLICNLFRQIMRALQDQCEFILCYYITIIRLDRMRTPVHGATNVLCMTFRDSGC